MVFTEKVAKIATYQTPIEDLIIFQNSKLIFLMIDSF